MKVVYNWLKDFVDVTATPDELASRLALSGTNIGGVEKGPHGAVIDAEVSSNRPDSLSHYGIAREIGAIYKLPLKAYRSRGSRNRLAAKASDAVKVEIQSPELCGRFTARVIRGVKIAAFAGVAERAARSVRRGQHQQRRRRDKLRNARTRPADAHLRLRQDSRSPHRRAHFARWRKDPDARWHRACDRCRNLHDRRRRWRACDRYRRHHGRRRN